MISKATRNPQRQIPSARPTNGRAFPESSAFSLMAPMAAAPILPTAIPPEIHARPTARAAATYLRAEESFASSVVRGEVCPWSYALIVLQQV